MARAVIDVEGELAMTVTTAFLAAALVVSTMPPPFLFDPTWNAAKIIRRGQSDPNLRVECSVDNNPLVIRLR